MDPIPLDFEFDIKKANETDSGKWIVEGYATTTDFDYQDDIVSQKAIEDSAKDLKTNTTVLFNHDLNNAIGKILESRATRSGLWIRVFVSKTVPEIWKKIQEGVINKFSIRGKILDARKQWVPKLKRWVQVILKMRLAEVSLVTVPANPRARALRWYVSKALHNFYENGGDLDVIEKGGTEMGSNGVEFLDEFLKAEERVDEGDFGESIEEGVTQKLSKAGAMDLLNQAIRETKDPKVKEMLQELKRQLAKYPKPAGKRISSGEKGLGDDSSSGPSFEDLENATDDEVKSTIEHAIQSIKDAFKDKESKDNRLEDSGVDETRAKLSKRDQSEPNDVVSKLNEAIEMIKVLVGKTNDESARELLDKFNEMKSLVDGKASDSEKNLNNAFEKIVEIQAKLADKSVETDGKVEKALVLIEKFFKGIGAVRNEDGTISIGDEAIKGVDRRKDDSDKSKNSLKSVTDSEDYIKAPINEKRKMLTNFIGDILDTKVSNRR